MPNDTHDTQWNKYSDGWVNIMPEERNSLLTQSV